MKYIYNVHMYILIPVPGMDSQTAVAVQSLIDSQVITEATPGKNPHQAKVIYRSLICTIIYMY